LKEKVECGAQEVNQFERTRKYSVLDERPDLRSKCCRRREKVECGAQE
jgi:hypothetical protein